MPRPFTSEPLVSYFLLNRKVWVRPSSELSFLYGNNVLKAGLGRITENTPEHQGVVVYSMGDVPLGFGVTARSTADCRRLAATDVVVYHQVTLVPTCAVPSRKPLRFIACPMSRLSLTLI